MKRLAILFCLVCAAFALTGADDDAIWEKWQKAYSLFEQGDRLGRKKDFAGAKKAYQSSFQLYQEIAREAPEWNHSVVANRMELAHRAIRDMERSGVASREKSRPLPNDLEACRKELTAARIRIDELQDETLRLRTAARSGQVSGADVESLLTEKRTLLAEQASLRQKIAALENRVATLSGNQTAGLEQKILQLESLLAGEKARSKTAEERVRSLEDELKRENLRKEDALKRLAASESARETAERAAATASFMARSREAELDQIQRDLTSAQVRNRNLESELRQREREVQTIQARFVRLQAGRHKEISAELVSENAELRDKSASLVRCNALLIEEAAQLDQRRIALQKENAERKTAQAQQGAELEKLRHSLKMLQESYRKETEAAKLGNAELKQLRLSCQDLSARIARFSGENHDLAEQLKNRDRQEQKDLKELSRRLGEMEQERDQLLAEAKNLRQRCEKMVSQIDEKSEELAALKRASSQDKREIAVLRQSNQQLKLLVQDRAEEPQKANPPAEKAEEQAAPQTASETASAEVKLLRRRIRELEKQRDELAILLRQQNVPVPQNSRDAAPAPDPIRQSMLSAARRAEADGDLESAIWFYRELLKRAPGNAVYQEKIRTLTAALQEAENRPQ